VKSEFLISYHHVLGGLIGAAILCELVARFSVDAAKMQLEDEATRRERALYNHVPIRVLTPLGQQFRKVAWSLWVVIFIMIVISFYLQKKEANQAAQTPPGLTLNVGGRL
jgi:hypothetical protein